MSLGASAHAQGIPVIDIAGLLQSIQEVAQSVEQIENQVTQIEQLGNQLSSLTGSRGLGAILNNPLLQNYVPANAASIVQSVESSGYGSLTASAKALRDARMIYNCLDKSGASRSQCQATLSQPYQSKAFMQDAMNTAQDRIAQIQSLMNQINLTSDPKGVAEIQARIEAESALIGHVTTQIQMASGMAATEKQIDDSRNKEAQMQQASRTGRLSDYVPAP